MEDKILLKGLRESNVAYYEKLIDEYGIYITHVVRRVAGNRLAKEDMEEICADVFIKVWEARKELTIKEGYLKSYLGAMARNKTFNKLRDVGEGCLPLEEDEITYDTPETNLMGKEDRELMTEVIGTLPEPDKEIFIRRYFYMEALASIAEKVGIPIGTVGTKLARGKKKLEKALKERGVAYE